MQRNGAPSFSHTYVYQTFKFTGNKEDWNFCDFSKEKEIFFLRDSASGTRTEVPKLKFYGAYIPFLFRSFELEIKRLEQVDTCIIMGDAGLWIPEWWLFFFLNKKLIFY